MIEMKFSDLDKPGMLPALMKLKTSDLPFKTAYAAGRILDILNSNLKEGRRAYLDLTRKHAELDAEGKPVVDPSRPNLYKVDTAKLETFLKEEKELFDVEIKIDKHKLKRTDVEELKLTPEEALALDVLLED
jgi:hypothetical protein